MDKKKPLPDRIERLDLPEMDMHGPIEVSIKVYMQLPSGEVGAMSVLAPPGVLPTRAELAAMLDEVLDPAKLAASAVPPGTKPQSKTEFVKHITKRETGLAMTLPGDPQFVATTSEIPHGMLVHAIQGVDIESEIDLSVAAELVNDYAERGFMIINRTPNEQNKVAIAWNTEALDALPDDVLLAIYSRITEAA